MPRHRAGLLPFVGRVGNISRATSIWRLVLLSLMLSWPGWLLVGRRKLKTEQDASDYVDWVLGEDVSARG